ncbi:hypothetical protein CR532_02070 [Candidatus Borreliella tachyglossi]|uniref:Outer membrane protein beta-barrel domain-containing protein n=1 Tax=Candidatus Borreliella tachyglossi TaxID=1964448 RepID=A0A2S1LWW9_9SPIR|nr:DUF3996 domain-containing protein [Candidatus Borreliella tachyglossi]AWG42782.1 hypothetical protein CR532_02070 [Candidatus Borreliella tachyglossi]
MGKNTQKILILLAMFNLHYFTFSKDNDPYIIKCNEENDGTTCITNGEDTIPKPKIPAKKKPKVIPIIQPPIIKQEKTPYNSFSIGIGTGSPVANILISVPYADIDFGYGSFFEFNPDNFKSYFLFGIDLIFTKQIGPSVTVGGGFGVGIDWSKVDLVPPGGSDTITYERIGTVARLPLVMEYKFAKNLSAGFKVYSALGPTILLTKPKILFEGTRLKFFAIGFFKFSI